MTVKITLPWVSHEEKLDLSTKGHNMVMAYNKFVLKACLYYEFHVISIMKKLMLAK